MSNQFLDLFTYEYITTEEQNHVFHNCTILKSMGNLQSGQKVAAIAGVANLYIWYNQSESEYEDVTVTL